MTLVSDSPSRIISTTRTALVVLDAENRFFYASEGGDPFPGAWILPNLERVIAASRSADILSVFVTLAVDEHALTGPWARRRHFLSADLAAQLDKSPWGRSIVSEAHVEVDDIRVHKIRTSAFFSTTLETYLRKNLIETLVLVGVALNGAIIATFTDAVSRDFYCFVVADASVGTTPARHDAALKVISDENVITSDELCAVWCS